MASVEVAAALDSFSSHVEQRVVVGGVDLGRQPLLDPGERVPQHAGDVRRTANRVLVLHVSVELEEFRACHPAGEDLVAVQRELRLGEQRSDVARATDHPRMRLSFVEQEGVEVAAVAEKRLRRHRGQQVRQVGEARGCSHRQACEGAHERGPVRKRQALLSLQQNRFDTQCGEYLARRSRLARKGDAAVSGESPAHIGQRREVAACPARAALGDVGKRVVVDQVEQSLDQLDAHPRVAFGEAVGAQQHRRPSYLGRGNGTRAAAHEAQDVLLKLARLAG